MTRAGQSRQVHTKHPCFRRCLQLAAIRCRSPPLASLSAPPTRRPPPWCPPSPAAWSRLDEVEVFTAQTSRPDPGPGGQQAGRHPAQLDHQRADHQQPDRADDPDYATIANIAPSVVNIETEGPGLSEAKQTSAMRGFADGQYNVTIDGIPFGDGNDYTHHTTSYFPAKVLGGEDIERGPGTAADIGQNTFGGTIGLLSKDPRPDAATVLTLSDGTWNSFLGNIEVNTGNLDKLNGGAIVGTYQYMSSDGYRTFSYLQRNTYYLKYLQPIGKNGTLTVVGNYNNIKFNNPGTATQAQINQFGRNYGLVADPFDPNNNFYPYNYQQKQADFEYIGYKVDLGSDFTIENKAYTDAYNNDSHEKPVDPVVGGTTKFPGTVALQTADGVHPYVNNSSNTLPGTTNASNDDPGGQIKVNSYRNFGDYFYIAHGEGTELKEQVGVWVEQVRANRYDYALDYSPAYLAANPQNAFFFGAFDPATGVKANTFKPGYQWYMHLYNKTFQPYIDLTWKPVPNLTIEAGVKDSNFTIDLDQAPLNPRGTEAPYFTNNAPTPTSSRISPPTTASRRTGRATCSWPRASRIRS